MQEILNRMRKRGDEDRGFTMIELLVVVVIIGVLVAIAVPVYLNYRKGAANKSAASDVRGAITAVEQYYTEHANTYPVDGESGLGADLTLGAGPEKITVSPGNIIAFVNTTDATTKATSYHICGRNEDGGQTYVYNSKTGGSVKKSASATFAACKTSGL
jgi:type IV pilus assembly protein PilA